MNSGIIFGNRIADIVFVAWFIAQFIKVILTLITEKKVNFKKFIDTGGMPSSHSATVTSLFTAVGLKEGFNSTPAAICLIFAMVVMSDAAGVRRAAGRQASALNKLIDNIWKKEGYRIIEENLKELLGHTPIEVFAGAVLGIVVALILN